MKNINFSLIRTTAMALQATLLSALALAACGDVAGGLSASSTESPLCRTDRCDDDGPRQDAPSESALGDADRSPATASEASDAGRSDSCQSDLDCAAGHECEYEHGATYCKPHGGHENERDDRADASSTDASPDAGAAACFEDHDCAPDERCRSIGGGQRACSSDHDEDRSGPNRGRH